MGPSELSWQMNANSIAQIIMVLPTMLLLSRRAGLRTVIHLGCGFIFIQNALWWAAARSIGVVPGDRGTTFTNAALLVGAVLGGFGEMMLQSTPSQLSAYWFPPHARGLVTAIAAIGGYVGQCISYLFDLDVTSASTLASALFIDVVLALLVFLLTLLIVRERPPMPWYDHDSEERMATQRSFDRRENADAREGETLLAEASRSTRGYPGAYGAGGSAGGSGSGFAWKEGGSGRALEKGRGFGDATATSKNKLPKKQDDLDGSSPSKSVKAANAVVGRRKWMRLCDLSCILLVTASATCNGVYQAWLSMVPILLERWHVFQDEGEGYGYSAGTGDLVSACALASFVLGACVGGLLSDRVFARRLKWLMVVGCIGAAVSCIPIALIAPPVFADTLTLKIPSSHTEIAFGSFAVVVGFFVGLTTAPSLELLAEHTYPLAEGVSASAYSVAVAATSVVYTVLLPVASTSTMHALLCGALIASACMLLATNGQYLRSNAALLIV